MEIDRKAFFDSLGGGDAVAGMSDEARAEALEHFMARQLNRAKAPGPSQEFPTAAEVEAQIETRPHRRGVGNLFLSSTGREQAPSDAGETHLGGFL